MAGAAGVFAGLVARVQVQHAQRRAGRVRGQRALQLGQRVQRQAVARALGGEEKQLVQAAGCAGRALFFDDFRVPVGHRIGGGAGCGSGRSRPALPWRGDRRGHHSRGHHSRGRHSRGRHRLEQREQRAQGLADAGGRLGQQATPGGGAGTLCVGVCGAVHGHGQLALPGAKRGQRKAQPRQGGVALLAVRGLAVRPGQVALALRGKERLQRGGGVFLHQHGLGMGGGVHVDQRKLEPRHPARLAQQVAVHLGLGPVQRAVVGAHAVQRAAVGLDFFELAQRRVPAIGAAAHRQVVVRAGQRHLGLVAGAAALLHRTVALHAFERAGGGGEAQVQVTRAGRELAQRAHGHHVGARGGRHAGPHHCTWHTCTGMPCATQYASQRIWLSCSLSPGAFTSTSA